MLPSAAMADWRVTFTSNRSVCSLPGAWLILAETAPLTMVYSTYLPSYGCVAIQNALLIVSKLLGASHFSPLVDGVRLSLIQFIVVAVESSAAALIFETPTLAEYGANFLPVVYCGVMSSGAGYTLQILGQKDLNPAIASLIMCLESVFSALGGWLLLGQNLSMRESAGCTLIFAAVVLSQLPFAELRRCKKGA